MYRDLPPLTFFIRLGKRFAGYGSVGMAAFLLDIALLTLLVTVTSIPFIPALVFSFLVGVSVNFLLQYNFVYAGTKRDAVPGYIFFVILALLSLLVVANGTWFLATYFEIPFLVARVLIGGVSGSINFLLNTFFNFKLV
ncbi:MAG: GtrA family protein [Candidatus Paceibacterota bacterium]